MAEYVVIGPPGQIKAGAGGKEVETGLSQFGAIFTRKPLHQYLVHGMQIAHIRRGIFALGFAQFRCAPVARLLLLGYFLAKKFAHEVFQAMPVGVSANELAGDFCAKDGLSYDAKIMVYRGKIEAGEMIKLHPRRISQHSLEIRRIECASRAEADKVFIPVAIGYLDQAQPVTRGYETHGFGINRNRTGRERALGEIFFMEMDSHMAKMLRLWASISQWA